MPDEAMVSSSDDAATTMSHAELKAAVMGEEAPPAPAAAPAKVEAPPVEQAPAPKPSEQPPVDTGKGGEDDLKARLEEARRLAGKVPALESRLSKLTDELKADRDARSAAEKTAQQRQQAQLSPEARAQQEQAERWLWETTGVNREQFKQLLERDQQRAQYEQVQQAESSIRQFTAHAEQLAGADWPRLEPIMTKLYNEHAAKALDGDPEAQTWMRNFLAHPAFGVLEAQRLGVADAATQAARGQAAVEAAKAAVAPSNASAGSHVAADKFSLDNLDNLSVTDLPAMREKMRAMGLLD